MEIALIIIVIIIAYLAGHKIGKEFGRNEVFAAILSTGCEVPEVVKEALSKWNKTT